MAKGTITAIIETAAGEILSRQTGNMSALMAQFDATPNAASMYYRGAGDVKIELAQSSTIWKPATNPRLGKGLTYQYQARIYTRSEYGCFSVRVRDEYARGESAMAALQGYSCTTRRSGFHPGDGLGSAQGFAVENGVEIMVEIPFRTSMSSQVPAGFDELKPDECHFRAM